MARKGGCLHSKNICSGVSHRIVFNLAMCLGSSICSISEEYFLGMGCEERRALAAESDQQRQGARQGLCRRRRRRSIPKMDVSGTLRVFRERMKESERCTWERCVCVRERVCVRVRACVRAFALNDSFQSFSLSLFAERP